MTEEAREYLDRVCKSARIQARVLDCHGETKAARELYDLSSTCFEVLMKDQYGSEFKTN